MLKVSSLISSSYRFVPIAVKLAFYKIRFDTSALVLAFKSDEAFLYITLRYSLSEEEYTDQFDTFISYRES